MLNKLIGIISYFPIDLKIRQVRKNKLDTLIAKCNKVFNNLPIYIVIQNWNNEEITYFKEKYTNLTLSSNYDKLGISKARSKLRNIFIQSAYDYLIMFDDDSELQGDSGKEYLKQIDENPDCFIENSKSRLKLFAISKTIFKKLDFPKIEVEKGEGFEDRIFFYTLTKKFPEAHKKFHNTGLTESSTASEDLNSTWYTQQNITSMLSKTEKIIKEGY